MRSQTFFLKTLPLEERYRVTQRRCGCAWIGNHQVLTCPDCHIQLALPFDVINGQEVRKEAVMKNSTLWLIGIWFTAAMFIGVFFFILGLAPNPWNRVL